VDGFRPNGAPPTTIAKPFYSSPNLAKQLTEDAAYWQRLSTVMDRVLALPGEDAEP
jgi:hypothetical protein